MDKIKVYFDREIGMYMLKGTRRKNNRVFASKEEAEIAAKKAQKAREKYYMIEEAKSIMISYNDLYGTVITKTDIPKNNSDIFRDYDDKTFRNLDSPGKAFVALYHEIWGNKNATRSLYDIAKNPKLLERLLKVGHAKVLKGRLKLTNDTISIIEKLSKSKE